MTVVAIPLGQPWQKGRALWVFAYGSLMYRVDFPVEAKEHGYIKGRKRAFLQKSHDHRGTPTDPGRVCTLVDDSSPEKVCWGVALKVQAGKEAEVKALLDYREKDGYTIEIVQVYTGERVIEDVVAYVGASSNPSFAPEHESSIEHTAQIIARAEGPSGSNREYLYKLCAALREAGKADSHLEELEKRVKEIVGS